jgi:uncharacterized BrkB/YihY/UPF0761 family membrane protein
MLAPQLLRLAWVYSASLMCVFGAEFAAVYEDSHGHVPPGEGPPLRGLAGGDAQGSHGVSSPADEGWWLRLSPGPSGGS